jgi:hypothetical protein
MAIVRQKKEIGITRSRKRHRQRVLKQLAEISAVCYINSMTERLGALGAPLNNAQEQELEELGFCPYEYIEVTDKYGNVVQQYYPYVMEDAYPLSPDVEQQ